MRFIPTSAHANAMPMRTLSSLGRSADADADADRKDVERERKRDDENLEEGRAHGHALRDDLVKLPA